jgi:hypothetical protein
MRRRSAPSVSSRPKVMLIVLVLCIFTFFNYRWALSSRGGAASRSAPGTADRKSTQQSTAAGGLTVEEHPSQQAAHHIQTTQGGGVQYSSAGDPHTTAPDTQTFNISFADALELFQDNQGAEVHEDIKQPTKGFVDVLEHPDHGVVLPHDPQQVSPEEEWAACDQRNAEFTLERDALCQRYLSNLNNMRSIKALSAVLKRGRTIKFKIFYHHNNIEAIVKVSQNKFVFEPVSEYLAFALDRELNLTRTPTAAYVALPLDFMKAASAIVSPFFSQWFRYFIVDYEFTKRFFVHCTYVGGGEGQKDCSLVSIQLWMKDVHSALYSTLAVPYEYDEHFARKYLNPTGAKRWPPKPERLRAVGDLNVRFIFDFMMGNTDRGMNDHNNFVYGGCDSTSRCAPEPPEDRTKGIAKYAFIDHGSSFYSRKEPEDNPFTGNLTDILICRFRKSTYETLKRFLPTNDDKEPLVTSVRAKLPKNLFRVVSVHTFQQTQVRLEKVLTVVESCITKYGAVGVFSLPEYWEG